MYETRTFRRRITTGLAFVVLLALVTAAISLYSLVSVIGTKDLVISDYAHALMEARALESSSDHHVSSSRAYLLTDDPQFLEKARNARERYLDTLNRFRSTVPDPEDLRLLIRVDETVVAHQAALDQAISIGRSSGDSRKVAEVFEAAVNPKREALRIAFAELIQRKERLLEAAVAQSRNDARLATVLVGSLGAGAVLAASGLFILNSRTLKRLGSAEAQLRDLNEHLEHRVAERTRQLRHAVGELEGFAYSISHDLRAPLRTMAGLSQLLLAESGPQLDENGRNDLTRIVEASRRMDDLIQGLLELIRLSYAEFPVKVIDVHDVIQQVIACKTQAIQAKGAQIVTDLALPSVLGNSALLRLVLEHLISNALEFTKPGVVPHLRIQSELHGTRVRIIVEDNGIGIPLEYRDRIFGVFHRLNRMEDHPGVGIGLALVRRASERMGGAVGLSSEPGSGSAFWIELEGTAEIRSPGCQDIPVARPT